LNILLIDNYDSFTYNLFDYLLQTGANCTVVRNDTYIPETFLRLHFDALVLSPGPKRPEAAGLMPWIIEHYHQRVPILGVCLGHQALGDFFGATVERAALPVHGKTSLIHHNDDPIFHNIPSPFTVMRYHSLVVENIASTPLQVLADTDAGEIMALRHPVLPLYGVQFHPESVLTEYGLQLLKNWVALVLGE
jgi:anthranilate synthase/aminodeoxychorismate synthase-like glutamine amidotransferase